MRILYIANHDSGGNDDEGAITYALSELGHDVVRLNEFGWKTTDYMYGSEGVDLVLFHKWCNPEALFQIGCPKVFWYFDLVRSGDIGLQRRDAGRLQWMMKVLPYVDIGFCTDGDWANETWTRNAKDQPEPHPKLVWLTQGADGRIVGRGKPTFKSDYDLLFTGIRKGGEKRASWVDEMTATYGSKFCHLERGYYRERLRDLIASSKIVLAPDGPVTARYWSNRVYNALGFGAFMIHPYCEGLTQHYGVTELVMYRSREELHELINDWLAHPNTRQLVSEAALERTKREHLYRHRVESLLKTVKEKLCPPPNPS